MAVYHLILYAAVSVKKKNFIIFFMAVFASSVSMISVQEAGVVIFALKSSMAAANRRSYPYLLVMATAREILPTSSCKGSCDQHFIC